MTPFDRRDAAPDGAYWPILRARRGELTALHHLDPAAPVVPVLEPSAGSRGPARDIEDVSRLLRETPPAGGPLGIDVSHLPDFGSLSLDLAEDLAERGTRLLPVVRAFDSARRLVEHGLAARMHTGRAVVRFQPHLDAANPPAADRVCTRLWRGTGLAPEQCHLLVDLADVGCSPHAARSEHQAARILRWARRHPWRSIAFGAGAMPPDLDHLPTDRPVRLRRWDAVLWRRVAGPGIGYADYGVTSPVRRDGVRHRPLPTLRYTAADAWWIYRWSRRGARGDDRCHQLCRAVTGAPYWPADGGRFCWGDAEIARRARAARGAGTATNWIAWATSHHLAVVLAELSAAVPARPGTAFAASPPEQPQQRRSA